MCMYFIMARLHCKCMILIALTVVAICVLWTQTDVLRNMMTTSEDDRFGIVPVEGLGRGGNAYPTKDPRKMYPTINPGQLRNKELGIILQDDLAVRKQRMGNWFEEGGEEKEKEENKVKTEKPLRVTLPPEQKAIPNGAPLVTMIPKLSGTNVISMTLYGSSLRYTMGAIRNAELAKANFPGWTLRI